MREIRKARILMLRRKLRCEDPHSALKELKVERERLQQDQQHDYLAWQLACMHLTKRFEMLAQGGRLHSTKRTCNLNLEPKPAETS